VSRLRRGADLPNGTRSYRPSRDRIRSSRSLSVAAVSVSHACDERVPSGRVSSARRRKERLSRRDGDVIWPPAAFGTRRREDGSRKRVKAASPGRRCETSSRTVSGRRYLSCSDVTALESTPGARVGVTPPTVAVPSGRSILRPSRSEASGPSVHTMTCF